jgi:hypothetical protein
MKTKIRLQLRAERKAELRRNRKERNQLLKSRPKSRKAA